MKEKKTRETPAKKPCKEKTHQDKKALNKEQEKDKMSTRIRLARS